MARLDTLENYAEIVRDLEARQVYPNQPPSLEPTRAALEESGLLSQLDPKKTVIVAGTNGKGSTCAYLEELLRQGGKSTGLYTSPHLIETTERIRISGRDISRAEFCRLFECSKELIEKHRLTHFEALTLMAVRAFVEAKVEWIILEVGLGGTWDATNAIPHSWCVISPIDFDHQNLLGRTLSEIAENKFGVVTPGAEVIFAPLDHSLEGLQKEVQAKTASRWHPRLEFKFRQIKQTTQSPPQFEMTFMGKEIPLKLPGERSAENAALALTTFRQLGFDALAQVSALSSVRWPGRMQVIDLPGSPCPVYVSGDHNPHGVRSLVDLLDAYSWKRLHLLVGIGKDKDADEMLQIFSGLFNLDLYLTCTPFKGRALSEYGPWLAKARGAWSDPLEGLKKIRDEHAEEGDLILVTGSLYLVGQILGAAQSGY